MNSICFCITNHLRKKERSKKKRLNAAQTQYRFSHQNDDPSTNLSTTIEESE